MPKQRIKSKIGSPDEPALARTNIERALAERRIASAEGYVQIYLEKGLITEAEAEGYRAAINRQRYGGAT